MTPDRAERIADYIRAELASVVLREMRDPRVSMLSVTDTQVSRDFAVADVYVSSAAATDDAVAAGVGVRAEQRGRFSAQRRCQATGMAEDA